MPAESFVQFEALETQAATLMERFKAAGYELVAPSFLQPAGVFLNSLGEAIRGRTYVFTDLDGEELCLRPDITVPACRLYLERHPEADEVARYCYNGPAFRYQPHSDNARQPREFRQAGIECIATADREETEAEVLALTVEAVRCAGLDDFRIRLGDMGLFHALIGALDIPERWRLRLWHYFWRPAAFHDVLHRLAADPETVLPGVADDLLDALDLEDPAAAEEQVAALLDELDIPLVGMRTLAEIAERLTDRAADSREAPLPDATMHLIESYLAVSGPPRAVAARVADLAEGAGVDLEDALGAYQRRLDCFAEKGVDLGNFEFSAEFGRNLEYYTGHVFQIEVPDAGRAGQVAGGGRYDELLLELGAPEKVPAVGCAIHTERLLAAVGVGS
ncbi:MAG: ATP phosphoribosyltransferase regulatory subunit [Hyphomicrobiales bacterium]|nr:ATP phosphoribosyltransferase regulatory subunit [Hyphomicrobiales bacterium]